MKIYIMDTYEAMSQKAAGIIAETIALNPECVLGLATGSTPVGTYRELVGSCQKGELDFSCVRTVNLDEYVGLASSHPQSYRRFMQDNLFDHINIARESTHLPKGTAVDLGDECAAYDQLIGRLGGIDLQVLGIGHNGHIGFNEPADEFLVNTHVVNLQESTIRANARFFPSAKEVPKQALTMGIRAIMQARRILMIVSGESKAEIVKAAFVGPVTPKVPASILQLHPDVVLVGDRAALHALCGE